MDAVHHVQERAQVQQQVQHHVRLVTILVKVLVKVELRELQVVQAVQAVQELVVEIVTVLVVDAALPHVMTDVILCVVTQASLPAQDVYRNVEMGVLIVVVTIVIVNRNHKILHE